MEFNKKVCNQISQEVEEAIAELFKDKYPDIEIKRGGGSYGPQEYTLKIKFSCENVNGETKMETDYKKYLGFLDMPEDRLNSTFVYNGKMLTVAGFLPNRRKNDILIRDAKGKDFIAPHEGVVRAYKQANLVGVGAK